MIAASILEAIGGFVVLIACAAFILWVCVCWACLGDLRKRIGDAEKRLCELERKP